MNRIEDRDDEVVELGVASIETKGLPAPAVDTVGGIHQQGGISND
jgi:hypothetical protein